MILKHFVIRTQSYMKYQAAAATEHKATLQNVKEKDEDHFQLGKLKT